MAHSTSTAVQADRTTGTGRAAHWLGFNQERRDPGGGLIARLAFALVGLLAGLVAARGGRRFGRAGWPPRLLGRLSVLVFAILVVALLVALTPARALIGGQSPTGFPSDAWQGSTTRRISGVGWPLALVALAWNGALGVALRRREASAELRRRTARAVTPPSARAPVRPRDDP